MYDLSEVENDLLFIFLQLCDLSEVMNLLRKVIYDVLRTPQYKRHF